MQVNYGNLEIDFTNYPAVSTVAMLRRGVAHYFGNEQAAKITNWKAKVKADTGSEPDESEIEAKKAELQAAAMEALKAGTVGTSTRGPAVDPVEDEMDRIARREIKKTLADNNLKFTGTGDDRKVKFPNGNAFTMDELVERRLNPEGAEFARIRKAAEKAIHDAEKQAAKAKAAGDKVSSEADLGL